MRVVRTNVGTCLGLAAALAASTAAGADAQYLSPQSPPAYGAAPLALNRPTALRGVAGGPVSLSSVDGGCLGYAQPMPSHILNVSPGTSQVRLGAVSDTDTTLMVQTPDGRILCDDDGGDGLNPLLDFAASPGQYRVWVGSYSPSTGGPYNLEATAIGAGPPSQPLQGALFGAIDMTAGARPDPMVLQGNFGGPIPAGNIDGNCRGWITGPPSHIVNARSGFRNLRFVGSAGSDTTLVVRYPDGHVQCDDDSGGAANPLVEGPTGPGQILVWVGSYASGSTGRYMLGVTTVPGVNYSNLGAPVGPPPVVVAPPPVIVTPPPSGIPPVTARVDLLPRIPVTLIGPGMALGTVAVWSPRGGSPVEVGIQRSRSGYTVYAVINGQMQTVAELPPAFVEQTLVTVTQRDGQRVLVRAEQAPNGSVAGQQALMLVQMVNGLPTIAEQWIGAFGAAAPRWAR